jgi:hypothetical protein
MTNCCLLRKSRISGALWNPEVSLLLSPKRAFYLYPKAHESGPRSFILFVHDQFYYFCPICAWVFPSGSFRRIFPPVTVDAFVFLPATSPVYGTLLDLITLMTFDEEYKS